MIIHCLSRLARRLNPPAAIGEGAEHPLGAWHAQWYGAGPGACIVFCHDLSRYLLYLDARGALDPDHLAHRFADLFLEVVASEGFETAVIADLARSMSPIVFDTRTNASVVASLAGIGRRIPHLANRAPVPASLGLSHRPTLVRGERIWPDKALAEMIQALQAGGRGH